MVKPLRVYLRELGQRRAGIPAAAAAPLPVGPRPARRPARRAVGQVLGLGALMSVAGGLPPVRPDQSLDSSSAGVAPGTASGTFKGRQVIVSGTVAGSGIFVYSGTPALGNPPVFAVVAPGVTQDPFGNSAIAVMNVGQLGGAHLGADNVGNLYLSDTTGKVRIYVSPSLAAMLVYDTTGLGTNTLTASIASAAGTDTKGNPFYAGIAAVADGTPRIATQLNAGALNFQRGSSVIATPAGAGSNDTAPLILFSGQVNATDVQASLAMVPALAGGVADHQFVGSLELLENIAPTSDASATGGPKVYGNTSGHVNVIADSRNGDGQPYDTEQVTLNSPGATINSNVTATTIFSRHVGVGPYTVEVWLVTTNTTAADGALIAFTGPAAAAGALVDFVSISGAGAGVVNHNVNSVYTTAFGTQGVAGGQSLYIKMSANFSAAGTLALTGKEAVAGNTVTVQQGSTMRITPQTVTA